MKITEINTECKYQGYLWLSDKPTPMVCYGDKTLQDVISEYVQNEGLDGSPLESVNPFVIEGILYDVTNRFSITIKYIDGVHICLSYENVSKELANENNVILKEFHANRIKGIDILHFLQFWRCENDDELCEGMNVLQPKELVFVGF